MIEDNVSMLLADVPIERGEGPLHRQIYASLKRMVRSHELEPGTQLPPEIDLAALWGVARGTVRRALLDLASEGVLERKPRRGTRVASPKIRQYLGSLTSFTEDMRSRGLTASSELISIECVAPSLPLRHLFGPDVELVWKVVRRRFANDLALAVETCHIGADRLDRADLECASPTSLYAMYRGSGLAPKRAVQRVEAVVLGQAHAALLDTRPGEPAFKQERITYDAQERVVEVVESFYRGDRYTLQVDLRDIS